MPLARSVIERALADPVGDGLHLTHRERALAAWHLRRGRTHAEAGDLVHEIALRKTARHDEKVRARTAVPRGLHVDEGIVRPRSARSARVTELTPARCEDGRYVVHEARRRPAVCAGVLVGRRARHRKGAVPRGTRVDGRIHDELHVVLDDVVRGSVGARVIDHGVTTA